MDLSALSPATRSLVSWLATYGIHSTVWLLAALLAVRWIGAPRVRARVLEAAVVAGLLTASAVHGLPQRPSFAIAPLVANFGPAPTGQEPVREAAGVIGVGASIGVSNAIAAHSIESAGEEPASTDWPLVLGVSWGVLALLGLLHLGSARRRLMRLIGRRDEITTGPVLAEWRQLRSRAPRAPSARLTRSSSFPSPVTLIGEVCIPARAEHELSSEERQGLLAHELAHIVRRDPLWLLALHAIERVFFFQPLLRVARKRIQTDMELASDDWAAGLLRGPLPVARCLARVAEWLEGEKPQALTPAMATSRSALVERVERLVSAPAQRASVSATIALVSVSAVAAAALSVAGPRVDLSDAAASELESSWNDVVAGVEEEREAAQELDVKTYRTAPGDDVRIVDFLHRDLIEVRETIGALGTVMLPEVGVIEVVGLTQAELRAKLTGIYEQYFAELDLHVQVLPVTRDLFVFGHVRSRGRQSFKSDLTVFEAIVAAGPKKTADLGKVKLIRADPTDPVIIEIDVARMQTTGDTTNNVLLRSGDILFVPGESTGVLAELLDDAPPEEGSRAALEGKIARFLRAEEDARQGGGRHFLDLALGNDGVIRTQDGQTFGTAGATSYDDIGAWLRKQLGLQKGAAPPLSDRTLRITGSASAQFGRVQRLLEVGASCGVYKWELLFDGKALQGALPHDVAEMAVPIEEGLPDTDPAWSQRPIEVELRVTIAGAKVDPETGAPWTGSGRFVYDSSRRVSYVVVGGAGRVVTTRTTTTELESVKRALGQLREQYPGRAVVVDAQAGIVYADVASLMDVIIDTGFTDIQFVGARR